MDTNPIGIQCLEKELHRYQRQSNANKNTAFIDDKFNIVATKNKQGDELYFTYGHGYWTDRLHKQTENPFTRIFIDIAFGDLKVGNNKYGEKIVQFQNVSGKYDDGVDNTIKQFYQLNDNSIKCGVLIELYETIVKQLDFRQLN